MASAFSRERLRRVPFKNLLWYSSAHHHQLIIISSSSSSSSSSSHHHHHLIIINIIIIIIISSSSSSSFPSLSLAFLFFSILAQPTSHEKRARCNPSQGKCVFRAKKCQKLRIFAILIFLEQPSAGIRLSSVALFTSSGLANSARKVSRSHFFVQLGRISFA